MKLSPKVINDSINLFEKKYNFPTQFINKMINAFHLTDCERTLKKSLSKNEKLKLILDAQGSLLFVGSKEINKEIRKRIIENWEENFINESFKKWCSGVELLHRLKFGNCQI